MEDLKDTSKSVRASVSTQRCCGPRVVAELYLKPDLDLGDLPYPSQLGWGDGYETWKWEIGNRVSIMGVVVMDDEGLQWIERSGTSERLCLVGDGTETSQQATAAGAHPVDR